MDHNYKKPVLTDEFWEQYEKEAKALMEKKIEEYAKTTDKMEDLNENNYANSDYERVGGLIKELDLSDELYEKWKKLKTTHNKDYEKSGDNNDKD